MSSFFNKLGKEVEEEIRKELIEFYKLYIENNAQISKEIENRAQKLASYEKQDIFENLPSQEIREAVAGTSSIFFSTILPSSKKLTKQQAEELLQKLQNNMK